MAKRPSAAMITFGPEISIECPPDEPSVGSRKLMSICEKRLTACSRFSYEIKA
jgi:hypothetical protein